MKSATKEKLKEFSLELSIQLLIVFSYFIIGLVGAIAIGYFLQYGVYTIILQSIITILFTSSGIYSLYKLINGGE